MARRYYDETPYNYRPSKKFEFTVKVIRPIGVGWLAGPPIQLRDERYAIRFKTMKAAKKSIPSWLGKGGYVEIYKREFGKKEKKLAYSNNPCILWKLARAGI